MGSQLSRVHCAFHRSLNNHLELQLGKSELDRETCDCAHAFETDAVAEAQGRAWSQGAADRPPDSIETWSPWSAAHAYAVQAAPILSTVWTQAPVRSEAIPTERWPPALRDQLSPDEPLRGSLIAFEGLDGSGITTQADLLRAALTDQYPVYQTREPSDGPAGLLIRLGLTHRLYAKPDGEPTPLNEAALALLFAADRIDHLYNEILPKLRGGITVICERYYLSTFAYQSISEDLGWLRAINSRARRPDLTIYLDVLPEISELRMRRQRWHVELYEEKEVLRLVRENYLRTIAELRREGENIEEIDGSASTKDVHQSVLRVVRKHLSTRPKLGSTSGTASLWDNPPVKALKSP